MTVAPDADWSSATVYVVGGGPSLLPWKSHLDDLPARGIVVGVNQSALEVAGCHALYTQDRRFYARIEKSGRLAQMVSSGTRIAIARRPGSLWAADMIRGAEHLDLVEPPAERGPGAIVQGLHSGHGALQWVILQGARDIVLLGYDLRPLGKGEVTRWNAGAMWAPKSDEVNWGRWVREMASIPIPGGVRVRNANPESAVKCFPCTTYAEEFECGR